MFFPDGFVRRLRLYLFAVLLFATQWVVSAHAVEHLSGELNNKGVVHVCEVCLAAHDLGNWLPSVSAVLPPSLLTFGQPQAWGMLVFASPAPIPSQRGPPLF